MFKRFYLRRIKENNIMVLLSIWLRLAMYFVDIITTSSWRAGQELILRELGPAKTRRTSQTSECPRGARSLNESIQSPKYWPTSQEHPTLQDYVRKKFCVNRWTWFILIRWGQKMNYICTLLLNIVDSKARVGGKVLK